MVVGVSETGFQLWYETCVSTFRQENSNNAIRVAFVAFQTLLSSSDELRLPGPCERLVFYIKDVGGGVCRNIALLTTKILQRILGPRPEDSQGLSVFHRVPDSQLQYVVDALDPQARACFAQTCRRCRDIVHHWRAQKLAEFSNHTGVKEKLPFFGITVPDALDPASFERWQFSQLIGAIQTMREAVRVSSVLTEQEREEVLALPFESLASDASLLFELLNTSYNLSLVTPFAEKKKFQHQDLSSYPSLTAKVGAVHAFLASSEADELQMIDGRGCHMTCLPAELCHLPSLLVLDISNNALTKIPEEIGRLSTLIILEMDENFLLDVPAYLVRLKELRTVTLSGNPCTSVPKEIKAQLPYCRFFLESPL